MRPKYRENKIISFEKAKFDSMKPGAPYITKIYSINGNQI